MPAGCCALAAALALAVGASARARRRIRPATIRATASSRACSTRARRRAGCASSRSRRKPAEFDSARGLTFINSDLAFRDHYVYQGNFAGFTIWDVSNPAKPVKVAVVPCVTSQGDPSIYGNLLFISAEGGGNRNDCAKGGVKDPDGSHGRRAHLRRLEPDGAEAVKNVQTCKGSHTHTVIPSPTDKGVIYIYVSGSQGARPETELAGCKNGTDPADENELAVPPRRDQGAARPSGEGRSRDGRAHLHGPRCRRRERAGAARRSRRRGGGGAAARCTQAARRRADPPPTGPRNCHDVTAYPAMHLLAGACASYGLLVDISNPEKPVRLDAAADTNFSLWHTAVFSNDGSKVVFTDEWGGGTSPNCQATSMMEMGGNTILTIGADKKFTQHAYFKIPTAQTRAGELRVAQRRARSGAGPRHHGAGLVSGRRRRDRLHRSRPSVRARVLRSRSGRSAAGAGDTATPRCSRSRGTIGGSWGAYYWNGYVYSSELARGFDILELLPSDKLSANELAAAKLVQYRRSTIRRASRRSCGRRRSRSCARTSISSCATTASRRRARRRSPGARRGGEADGRGARRSR